MSLLVLVVMSLSACGYVYRKDSIDKGISPEVEASELRVLESHTLSRLAAIERSLNDFIRGEGRIPKKLNELVPRYIAEIPEVELGYRGHRPNDEIRYYGSSVIVDGQINGAMLDDTGGWGYAFNDRRVIIFVDSTRKRADGTPWYRSRGVY